MDIINELKTRTLRLPIHSATDIKQGALMVVGATAETDLGTLIVNAASSTGNAIGVLAEPFDYSVNGSALVDGSVDWFAPQGGSELLYPSKAISLLNPATMCRLEYDLTSTIQVTGGDAAGTLTIANLESGIDTSFIYVVSGTGLGQTGFIKSSAAGSCVLTTDLTVPLDTTSYIVKILRLFHTLFVLTVPSGTAGTKFGTTAAAGAARMLNYQNVIQRNGVEELMNPKAHHNLQKLNSLAQLAFYSNVVITNTVADPIA